MMSTEKEKDLERAKDQAKAQLESIQEMVKILQSEDGGEYDGETISQDDVRERIQEDPLEVSVRGNWHTPGEKAEDSEYLILLCTGGPAVRIIGDLGKYNEPETARLEYQDWFTPWVEYPLTGEEEKDVLTYAREFYYGEA